MAPAGSGGLAGGAPGQVGQNSVERQVAKNFSTSLKATGIAGVLLK